MNIINATTATNTATTTATTTAKWRPAIAHFETPPSPRMRSYNTARATSQAFFTGTQYAQPSFPILSLY